MSVAIPLKVNLYGYVYDDNYKLEKAIINCSGIFQTHSDSTGKITYKLKRNNDKKLSLDAPD